MRSILFVIGLTLVSMIGITNEVSARKVQINETVRDAEGCEWKIEGWIDISLEFGWPPISVNHYDINMSGLVGNIIL